jgi:hypothetical protein
MQFRHGSAFIFCSPRPSATAIAVFTPGVATVQPRRFLRIVSRVGDGRRTRIAHASSAKTAPHTPAKYKAATRRALVFKGWFFGSRGGHRCSALADKPLRVELYSYWVCLE